MREIMDTVSDREVETVVIMSSAQVGKTEVILNTIGYYMHQDPSPILQLQPTLEMAEAVSKDRIVPMLRDTPVLTNLVASPRARDSGNTLLHKVFPGGHITLAGANSPSSLASRPIRVLLADEVDRYPASAGTEGDPVALARKRTATFMAGRKIILTSTPTVRGFSRIEHAYEQSDKRVYLVPCHDCGHEQRLMWANVVWEPGKPHTAAYTCEHCGSVWTDHDRWVQIRKGRWQATAPFTGVAGFHLSALYSPWTTIVQIVTEFCEAQGKPEMLKTWVNTTLGETWDEDSEKIDPMAIMDRLEDWGRYAPEESLVVTVGVDVQDDRLEIERVAWGMEEESWSLDHTILYGDPSGTELWRELDEYLLTPTYTADGRELRVAATAVDSGGHHTQAVYRFVKDKVGRRVWAIKGIAGPGRPVWPPRASKNNSGRINLFLVGADAGKDSVIARLKMPMPGPGYCHFPVGRDVEYFKQLAAERVVTKYYKGFGKRVYEKDPSTRNEALDLRVYAYAALCSLKVDWRREQRRAEYAARVPIENIEVNEPVIAEAVKEPVKAPSRVEAYVAQRAKDMRALSTRRASRSSFMSR